MTVEINWLAVIVAGIVNMVIGYLWYGPIFGKMWMSLSGIVMTPEKMAEMKQKGMGKSYALMFVGALIMALVLFKSIASVSGFLQESGASVGVMVGFFSWLGFIAPVLLGSVLWEGKSWKLWIFNNAYYLAVLLVNGAILASFM
jgi:hypothetical protein